MPKSDYAFDAAYDYSVNRIIYDYHRSYDYDKKHTRYEPSLLETLQNIHNLDDNYKLDLIRQLKDRSSKPVISLGVRNYESYAKVKEISFLVDTGADITILTAETATYLEIDRSIKSDPIIIRGIDNYPLAGLPRWIYVDLGGKLHPIPVLVPPEMEYVQIKSIRPRKNYLGRAAVTNCFLICFDNKRFYAFARRNSEPPM
jgi:hypothetical protein